MHTNHNLTSSSTSLPTLSSNAISIPNHYFSLTASSQILASIHIPPFPMSTMQNTPPLPQQSYQHSYQNETRL
jgi:hypothetical protein